MKLFKINIGDFVRINPKVYGEWPGTYTVTWVGFIFVDIRSKDGIEIHIHKNSLIPAYIGNDAYETV